jgi:hypothetical protein
MDLSVEHEYIHSFSLKSSALFQLLCDHEETLIKVAKAARVLRQNGDERQPLVKSK